jgi:hypothetical protein
LSAADTPDVSVDAICDICDEMAHNTKHEESSLKLVVEVKALEMNSSIGFPPNHCVSL